jgi:hypothetical protein
MGYAAEAISGESGDSLANIGTAGCKPAAQEVNSMRKIESETNKQVLPEIRKAAACSAK